MERLGPFDRFISWYKITDLINHAVVELSLLGAKGGSLDPKDPPPPPPPPPPESAPGVLVQTEPWLSDLFKETRK